jgi:hypothetical protein
MTSGTSARAGTASTIVAMTTFQHLDADLTPRATVRRLLRTRPGRFITTYLEMTLAMLIGMGLFGALWDSLWPGMTRRPDAMAVTMAADMTLGMAAWMWVRGHAGRHTVEMSAVMVLPFLVLLWPYRVGILPGDALLTGGHIGMFALMAAYLVWRPHTRTATASLPRTGVTPVSRHSRVACLLLVGGAGTAVVAGLLHPHDELPNSHVAAFNEYAHSTDWVWVHDLQFLSAALVVAGLLVLGRALQRVGAAPALLRLGDAAAAATAALIAVNMAVDGIALKRAVDAWVDAPPQDRATRFAAAETVRWLEWGVNSYFTILLGLTLLVFAGALLQHGELGAPVRLAAVTGTLAGALLVLNGLTVGAQGFEPTSLPQLATGLYLAMALGIAGLDRHAVTPRSTT